MASPELRYYDELAARYHQLMAQPVQAYAKRVEGELVRGLLAGAERIAVVGIGGGRELAFLPDSTREVWAIDFSAEMLHQAEAELDRLRAAGGGRWDRTEFVQADAAELPLADDSVDAVLCLAALNYMPRHREAVRDMARVTRPDGTVAINVINRLELAARVKALPKQVRTRLKRRSTPAAKRSSPYREVFTEQDLIGMYRDAGLRVTSVHGIRLLVDLVPDAWNRDPALRARSERTIGLLAGPERALLKFAPLRRRARFLLVAGEPG